MVESIARIRPFLLSDDKLVRFAIGQAIMESLAVANRRAYFHPLTIAVWLLVSSIFTEVMEWWPKSQYGILGYLSPLRAFASTAVPIMYLIDWLNRPFFEKHLQDALQKADVLDVSEYYSRSVSSGFWILEYGDRFVGLIALDASLDSTDDEPISVEKLAARKRSKSKATSPTATIRHFFIDEPFRTSGIQNDLLAHAVQHAFDSDPALQQIRAQDSPLIPYARTALREAGFQLTRHTEKVGVFGWKLGMRVLESRDWKKDGDKVE
jgi:GNAT superfamily N-acetyltransferase